MAQKTSKSCYCSSRFISSILGTIERTFEWPILSVCLSSRSGRLGSHRAVCRSVRRAGETRQRSRGPAEPPRTARSRSQPARLRRPLHSVTSTGSTAAAAAGSPPTGRRRPARRRCRAIDPGWDPCLSHFDVFDDFVLKLSPC